MLYNLEGSATFVAQLLALTHPYRQTTMPANLRSAGKHLMARVRSSSQISLAHFHAHIHKCRHT